MMNQIAMSLKNRASTSAVMSPPVSHADQPIVFVDGTPEPRLHVDEWRVDTPLDEHSVILKVVGRSPNDRTAEVVDRWIHADTTVAMPVRLVDEQVRWQILAHGQLGHVEADLAPRRDDLQLELVDAWTGRLEHGVAASWWESAWGDLRYDRTQNAVMRNGGQANKSTRKWEINGRKVHVFQTNGQPWSVGEALRSLAAMADIDLRFGLLPSRIDREPILESISLDWPLRDTLRLLLEAHGLILQREMRRSADGDRISEEIVVRPATATRPIHIGWPREGQPLGQVQHKTCEHPLDVTAPAVVRAGNSTGGWIVEGTFNLVNGWDPALATESDAAYGRPTSPDFATYANVFRLWVLNEDGRFSGAPFNAGPPFDLESFFESNATSDLGVRQDPVRPQPLQFMPTLIVDQSGTRRPPVVEVSEDGGQSWTTASGRPVLPSDRAAVYLDDDELPASFLAAAKAGQAQVRVTASLQNPAPVEMVRWRGNAFRSGPSDGLENALIFDVGGAFGFRRVDSSSIHHAQVINGQLVADEADQTRELHDWLMSRLQSGDRIGGLNSSSRGRCKLSLTGTWPWLRPGDRMINPAGRGETLDGRPEAVKSGGDRTATLQRVRCRWEGRGQPSTELSLAV